MVMIAPAVNAASWTARSGRSSRSLDETRAISEVAMPYNGQRTTAETLPFRDVEESKSPVTKAITTCLGPGGRDVATNPSTPTAATSGSHSTAPLAARCHHGPSTAIVVAEPTMARATGTRDRGTVRPSHAPCHRAFQGKCSEFVRCFRPCRVIPSKLLPNIVIMTTAAG